METVGIHKPTSAVDAVAMNPCSFRIWEQKRKMTAGFLVSFLTVRSITLLRELFLLPIFRVQRMRVHLSFDFYGCFATA